MASLNDLSLNQYELFMHGMELEQRVERLHQIRDHFERLAGYTLRPHLSKYFASLQSMLTGGSRFHRRYAQRRISVCRNVLAHYGHKLDASAATAVSQLIDFARAWSRDRLHLLYWATSAATAQPDDSQAWRVRQRINELIRQYAAPSIRRSRLLKALMAISAGFFGSLKADERNNP